MLEIVSPLTCSRWTASEISDPGNLTDLAADCPILTRFYHTPILTQLEDQNSFTKFPWGDILSFLKIPVV